MPRAHSSLVALSMALSIAWSAASLVTGASLAGCAAAGDAGSGSSGGSKADGSHPADLRMGSMVCGTCPLKLPLCNPQTKQCVACLTDGDCPAGNHCHGGACVPACSAQRPCGDAGVCNLDGGTCGGCGTDADCKDPRTPFCNHGSGRCEACSPGADHCPMGSYCGMQNGGPACVMGCKTDDECAAANNSDPAWRCCNHACADTSSTATSCGSCTTACMQGASCCTGSCLDTSADLSNCGFCGNTCTVPNATPVCSGGTCSIGQCNNKYGDCDNNPQNGCESNLKNDDFNCGKCNKSCIFACINGSCIPF